MSIEKFNIQVADEVLNDLKYRLECIRWSEQLECSGSGTGQVCI